MYGIFFPGASKRNSSALHKGNNNQLSVVYLQLYAVLHEVDGNLAFYSVSDLLLGLPSRVNIHFVIVGHFERMQLRGSHFWKLFCGYLWCMEFIDSNDCHRGWYDLGCFGGVRNNFLPPF